MSCDGLLASSRDHGPKFLKSPLSDAHSGFGRLFPQHSCGAQQAHLGGFPIETGLLQAFHSLFGFFATTTLT